MSTAKPSAIFDKTLEHSWRWIDDLIEDLELTDARSAYRVLRAAIHTLRDRLTVDEAVNLGAQLPMLLRGLYYEGWRPSETPLKLRTKQSFFDRLATELVEGRDPEPEEAARAVFDLIARHISGGEIEQIRGMMPSELKGLWLPEIPAKKSPSPGAKAEHVPSKILQAVAHRAPVADKPTVERIGIQHSQLRELMASIGEMLSSVCEGPETEREAARAAARKDLPTLMNELREAIEEHFSLEENAGFVTKAISTVPQLSRRSAAFPKQHAALLSRASGLSDEAAESGESATHWAALLSDFRAFANDFRRHEREEGEFLQDAYLQDESQGG